VEYRRNASAHPFLTSHGHVASNPNVTTPTMAKRRYYPSK
jgi:hypothetical protein